MRVATMGSPEAIASMSEFGIASLSDGSRKRSAAWRYSTTFVVYPVKVTSDSRA